MKKLLRSLLILIALGNLMLMEVYAMEKSKLTKKEESIVEIAGFTATGKLEDLAMALNKALDNKMTINEINEILIQSYAYCGFPRSLNAISTFKNVVDERKAKGKKDKQGKEANVLPSDADKSEIGRKTREELLGRPVTGAWQTFAPRIDQYLKEHLFGDIYARGLLSHQERELVTVAFLSSLEGVDPQLNSHLNMAKNTGLSQAKLDYAVKYVRFITETGMGVFSRGDENKGYAKYFIGTSYLAPLVETVSISNVVFEPGCRNNWHIHHGGGQILLVTGGNGYFQEWGKPARKLKAGDVVDIPAGVKHWHGAAPDSFFAHIAIAVPAENATNEWLEPVDDKTYNNLEQ